VSTDYFCELNAIGVINQYCPIAYDVRPRNAVSRLNAF